jgi:hypothetical protein
MLGVVPMSGAHPEGVSSEVTELERDDRDGIGPENDFFGPVRGEDPQWNMPVESPERRDGRQSASAVLIGRREGAT